MFIGSPILLEKCTWWSHTPDDLQALLPLVHLHLSHVNYTQCLPSCKQPFCSCCKVKKNLQSPLLCERLPGVQEITLQMAGSLCRADSVNFLASSHCAKDVITGGQSLSWRACLFLHGGYYLSNVYLQYLYLPLNYGILSHGCNFWPAPALSNQLGKVGGNEQVVI